jgi:hypothetical protein
MSELQDSGPVELEGLIRHGSEKIDAARTVLRKWLIERTGGSEEGLTIAAAIASIGPTPNAGSVPAKILLRCLAVPGLVPPANPTNQLARYAVTLCEGALPEICDFLHLSAVKQNHEKFAILISAHERIADLLSPLRAQYIGMESFGSSRPTVVASLNHGIVRSYGQPFRLGEMRRIIEVVYQKMARAASLEATLSNDVADCREIISDGRTFVKETPTVLNLDYLQPFLDSAEAALETFLKSIESRLATEISIGGAGSELQKRYPLHSPKRRLQIQIPLRNIGPGTATNVRGPLSPETAN